MPVLMKSPGIMAPSAIKKISHPKIEEDKEDAKQKPDAFHNEILFQYPLYDKSNGYNENSIVLYKASIPKGTAKSISPPAGTGVKNENKYNGNS